MEIQSLDPLVVEFSGGLEAEFDNGRWRIPTGWRSAENLARHVDVSLDAIEALEACHRAFVRTREAVIQREREVAKREASAEASRRVTEKLVQLSGVTAYRRYVNEELADLARRYNPPKDLPPQLQHIGDVRRFSPTMLGRVYFLVRNGRVVYVGKTAGPWPHRILTHARSEEKVFDSVWYLVCDAEELDGLEARFIRRLTPEYNKVGLP